MVRYGVDDGVDEVDNIQSKPAQPINVKFSKNLLNKNRRGSLTEDEAVHTDDDSNVLSKSVPATLPSYFNYSEDSDYEDRQERQLNNSILYKSFDSRNSSARNNSSTDLSESYRQKTKLNENKFSLLYPIIALVSVVIAICIMLNRNVSEEDNVYDRLKFSNDLDSLAKTYNIEENSLLQLQTGISTISEKKDTGSFIFVFNDSSKHFDADKFNDFINNVSIAASRYLRNDSAPNKYTKVELEELQAMLEHGELIARYREELHKTGVMLVQHLETVPAELAMAFHYYCDEYNPLVQKSAIFFTLNMANCPLRQKHPHASIEECLARKWRGIPSDSMLPLLARVVNVVIDVTKF